MGAGFGTDNQSFLVFQFVGFMPLFSFSSTFCGANLVASFKSSDHG